MYARSAEIQLRMSLQMNVLSAALKRKCLKRWNRREEDVMKNLRMYFILTSSFLYLIFSAIAGADQKESAIADEAKLSSQTKACIGCHKMYTPGIVEDWLSSRHSNITPSDALKKTALERRISTDKLSSDLSG